MTTTNNHTIRAIETHYNGYRFRSRLEARWAVFFDTLGIRYEYEPEGFDLGAVGWYLPDFFLPDYSYFVEIKGKEPTREEVGKTVTLAFATRVPTILFHGLPGEHAGCATFDEQLISEDGTVIPRWYDITHKGDDVWWYQCVICHQVDLTLLSMRHAFSLPDKPFPQSTRWLKYEDNAFRIGLCHCPTRPFTYLKPIHDVTPSEEEQRALDALQPAYDAARAARFEYGEHGRTPR